MTKSIVCTIIFFSGIIELFSSVITNTTNYYIWLPIGELIDMPCDPYLLSLKEQVVPFAAAEWYDIGGFYLHTGFILPVKAFTEKYLYGLVCNIRDIDGSILYHIEHHVTVFYQPIILWAFTLNLNKSVILENEYLKKVYEIKFSRLSDKLDKLCEESEECCYQFIYFHKSIYQKYLINGAVPNEEVKKKMDNLDGDTIPVTFYFKVGFPQYAALLLNPFTTAYRNYVLEKQLHFRHIIQENAIDIFLTKSVFFDGKMYYDTTIELICPGGSEDIVGFITCRKCSPGFFAKPGARCQPCEYGSFQGSYGSSSCNICPDLYTTLDRASTSEDDCIFDGPLWTTFFVYVSRRVWANVVTSYRTFSIIFLIITFIYLLISILVVGWFSYRIHLYRKIKRRKKLAFEQLLTINTIGNINLDLD